jgi:hypothetical protein
MSKSVKKTPAKKVPAKVVAEAPTKVPATEAKVIKVLVTENPKRGASHTRFARYKTGMKVADYVERCVKAGDPSSLARADIRWDVAHEYIAVR